MEVMRDPQVSLASPQEGVDRIANPFLTAEQRDKREARVDIHFKSGCRIFSQHLSGENTAHMCLKLVQFQHCIGGCDRPSVS